MGIGKPRAGQRESSSPSPVVAFLVRRGLAGSDRRATRAVAVATAAAALLAVVAWAWSRSADQTPPPKRYEEMTSEERAALPAEHRLYLEELARERAWREEQEARSQYR